MAASLTVLEALHLKTGRPAYRVLFEFWLKIFGLAFGLGVVSAFQFGTNWSVLSRMSGPIQGPLLSYETFTAFALEASFFGVLIFGRSRVAPWFYLLSTAMVALGTTLSAFWIMVNNSWMQVPFGYVVENGAFVPDDWTTTIFNSVVWVRFLALSEAASCSGLSFSASRCRTRRKWAGSPGRSDGHIDLPIGVRFWGEGLFIFPLMLLYTMISYSVFRGKVASSFEH